LNERSDEEGAFFTVRGEPNDINNLREQLLLLQ
jgi:GTPase